MKLEIEEMKAYGSGNIGTAYSALGAVRKLLNTMEKLMGLH